MEFYKHYFGVKIPYHFMIPFLLAGKEVNIPSGYHELTLKQFVQMTELSDPTDILSTLEILTGVSAKTWSHAALDSVNIQALNIALDWSNKKVDWNKFPVPEKIKLGEKEVTIPKRIDIKTFGQKIAFDKMILDKAKVEDETITLPPSLMATAIAIYMEPEYSGKEFESDLVGDMVKMVSGLPVTQAIPLASFFLRKSLHLKMVKLKSFIPKMNTQKTDRKDLKSMEAIT